VINGADVSLALPGSVLRSYPPVEESQAVANGIRR
jgi:hypothetical protein